jgi:CheY-like chemotaxis protein
MTKKILIAEDDMLNACMLLEAFMRIDCLCTLVNNGNDLLHLAVNGSSYDLIISDVFMPNSNGDDVIRTLQNLKIDIPIILISGEADFVPPEGIQFFSKPDYLPKLLDRVGELFKDS